MSKFFVKSNQIKESKLEIFGEDVNHIKNVLRLDIDSEINVCDSDNSINYICKISSISSQKIECTIIKKLESNSESNVELYIFQRLPKADKMELIIQKGTELGVLEFIPVSFKRSIVKLSGKDEIKKIERWNKISEVAAKQCGRDIVPLVRNIENIENISKEIESYDLVLVAFENEKNNYIKNELLKLKNTKKDKYKIAVIIGPEGGLEQDEVEILEKQGAKIVSLGRRILRTETVALQVSSIIMYELEGGGIN